MSASDYKSFWNAKATTKTAAMIAVDGSSDEEVLRLTGAYSAGQVAAALDLRPQDRVLELGCGVGRIGVHLAPRCAYWHGADVAENMLAHARERLAGHDNVGFTALTRSQLDGLAEHGFDAAYAVAVFIHMDKEDWVLYLHELARVLKPGGRLYFDIWNLDHPIGYKRFDYEVRQYRDVPAGQRKDVARNQFATAQEARVYLRHAGFLEALILDDSPQLQVMAIKPGPIDPLAYAERLARAQQRIAYSPRWTALFDELMHIMYEGRSPRALYDGFDPNATDSETPMFRAWVRAMWRQNEARFGPAPTD